MPEMTAAEMMAQQVANDARRRMMQNLDAQKRPGEKNPLNLPVLMPKELGLMAAPRG